MDTRLMRQKQAQQYLSMSHGTLYALRMKGIIPTITIGKSLFYDREALDRYIDSLSATSSQETK